MSWKFGMSGITPSGRAALVTWLFQSKISTPGVNNQSSSDSCGGLGTNYCPLKTFQQLDGIMELQADSCQLSGRTARPASSWLEEMCLDIAWCLHMHTRMLPTPHEKRQDIWTGENLFARSFKKRTINRTKFSACLMLLQLRINNYFNDAAVCMSYSNVMA